MVFDWFEFDNDVTQCNLNVSRNYLGSRCLARFRRLHLPGFALASSVASAKPLAQCFGFFGCISQALRLFGRMRANNPTDSSDGSAVDSVDPVSIVEGKGTTKWTHGHRRMLKEEHRRAVREVASLQRALNEDYYSESDGAEATLPQYVRVNPAEQAVALRQLDEEGISYYVLNEEERQVMHQFRLEEH